MAFASSWMLHPACNVVSLSPCRRILRMARMGGDDDEFKILLGRIGNQDGHKSFISEVRRAMRKAGEERVMGGRGSGTRRSTFGRGRTAFGRSRLFGAQGRVAARARVVRHQGGAFRSAPLSAHVTYLERVMFGNPYRLARDIRSIGFKTADAIAMKLGIEKTAMIHVRAGIPYALT